MTRLPRQAATPTARIARVPRRRAAVRAALDSRLCPVFASLGIPAPGLTAPFVAVTETVGGVLLIAGLATPLVSAALAIDMLVALLTAHIGQGFFASDGGIELALLLGGASLCTGLAGAGRFSLDASLDLPQRECAV